MDNKEKIMEEVQESNESHAQRAARLFKSGYNCSQAVFAAFAEDYGIDRELALRLSASFGGGMGRMREVCGAFSGMIMVNGLETGCVDGSAQGKLENYEAVQHLAEEYKKKSGGSIICRELLGLDKADNGKVEKSEPTPTARTEGYYKKRPCIQLVMDACDILDAELNKIGKVRE
ncbi:MAG: C-GCAxxG-C-C family protein [Eubacteriales bacterium]|nr:C-GCAxxG-C-C family protein [Eubacteriales bacterium]